MCSVKRPTRASSHVAHLRASTDSRFCRMPYNSNPPQAPNIYFSCYLITWLVLICIVNSTKNSQYNHRLVCVHSPFMVFQHPLASLRALAPLATSPLLPTSFTDYGCCCCHVLNAPTTCPLLLHYIIPTRSMLPHISPAFFSGDLSNHCTCFVPSLSQP